MRRIAKRAVQIAKYIWRGFWEGIGALLAAAGISCLLTHIGPIREWAGRQLGHLVAPGRIDLTIFLTVLSTVLLGLWISSQIRLYRLRQRVRRNMLTIGDLASQKDLIKALDELDSSWRPSRPERCGRHLSATCDQISMTAPYLKLQ